METAEKAVKTAGKATTPNDQLATGRDAWKAWDTVIRSAKGVPLRTIEELSHHSRTVEGNSPPT